MVRWILENNNVPKEWKELLPEMVVSFIESKISPENQFPAMNALVTYQDITHKAICKEDIDLVMKLIKEYL